MQIISYHQWLLIKYAYHLPRNTGFFYHLPPKELRLSDAYRTVCYVPQGAPQVPPLSYSLCANFASPSQLTGDVCLIIKNETP